MTVGTCISGVLCLGAREGWSWLGRRLVLGQGPGAEHPWAASLGNHPGPSMSSSSAGGAKQPQIPRQTSCRAGSPPPAGPGSSTAQLWQTLHREGQGGSVPPISAPTAILSHGDLPSAGTRHGDTAPLQTWASRPYRPSRSVGRRLPAPCWVSRHPQPPWGHFRDTKRCSDTRELLSSPAPARCWHRLWAALCRLPGARQRGLVADPESEPVTQPRRCWLQFRATITY